MDLTYDQCMLNWTDKKGNTHALIAKYSDYIKKQYNYNKDLKDEFSPGTKGILEKRACLGPNPSVLTKSIDECGYSTMASASALQAEDEGSIPFTRSN